MFAKVQRVNPEVRFQTDNTGHPELVKLGEVLQDFQASDRADIRKRYGKALKEATLYRRPCYYEQSQPSFYYHGDAAVYVGFRPKKDIRRLFAYGRTSIPDPIKIKTSGPIGIDLGHYYFYVRVINQTPEPKSGLYRVHWLRTIPLADHAPNMSGIAWTYGVSPYDYRFLTLENRT